MGGTTVYYGNATYYNLCNGFNGAGAYFGCACNNNALHTAYPHCPETGCYHHCISMLSKPYCSTVIVTYDCPGGQQITVSVRDCACFNLPGQGCTATCGYYSIGCKQVAPPLLDLTEAAFQATGAPLWLGRIPIILYP
jgi:hypothetical protein